MQSHSPAAVAAGGPAVVYEQQQLVSPDQRHDSSYTTAQPAQPPAGSTAGAAGNQPSDSPQLMQHGIPGFAAMLPEQQSAAIMAKWGMSPAPEMQRQQQLMQQSQEQQQQQQQGLQAGQSQVMAVPSHTAAAQQGGPTRSAPAASASDQVAATTGFTVPDGLDRAAPAVSLHLAQGDGSQVDRGDRAQDKASQPGFSMTAQDATQNDDAGHSSHLGGSQSGQQLQGGEQGGSGMVSEHNDANEEGLALEQPDGEGSAPLVTPEVVRGRVVRATEMLHRQRLQQEARQQVTACIPDSSEHPTAMRRSASLLDALSVCA